MIDPPLVIKPNTVDVLAMLDRHSKHRIGASIRSKALKRGTSGPQHKIPDSEIPKLKKAMNQPGATAQSVATAWGVSRATLYNTLRRGKNNPKD